MHRGKSSIRYSLPPITSDTLVTGMRLDWYIDRSPHLLLKSNDRQESESGLQHLETVYIIKYLGSTKEMTSAAFESCDLFHSVQAMKRADGEKKVN